MLPFEKSYSQRLIRIAKDKRLAPHGGLLPADNQILNKICSLTDEKFHELLEAGDIYPGMKRNDMAVHAAQDSLGRDLAFRGSWESIGPGSSCERPTTQAP